LPPLHFHFLFTLRVSMFLLSSFSRRVAPDLSPTDIFLRHAAAAASATPATRLALSPAEPTAISSFSEFFRFADGLLQMPIFAAAFAADSFSLISLFDTFFSRHLGTHREGISMDFAGF
jgi:hypothetical protein